MTLYVWLVWVWPKNPVVDDDHDDDRAPEGHEGGEEGVGEVGVEDAEAAVLADGRFSRPGDDDWDLLIQSDPARKEDQLD